MRKLNHVSEDKIQEMISDRFSSKNNALLILEKNQIKAEPKADRIIYREDARETDVSPPDRLANYCN